MQGVPYYSQWESRTLAADIIEGRCALADDPKWATSGAVSLEEYAQWANHICGMACLKMILAARTGKAYETLQLARMALDYGAFRLKDGSIHGLIYAPFVEMVSSDYCVLIFRAAGTIFPCDARVSAAAHEQHVPVQCSATMSLHIETG